MYDKKAIGRRLRSGMVDNGMSVADFAKIMGVSRQCVYDWMSGDSAISFECANRICDIYKWSLDRLAVRGEYADQVMK